MMLKENVEFVEAVKIIAQYEGIDLEYDNDQKSEDNTSKQEIRACLEWACSHFASHEVPESFAKYRAFPEEVLNTFKIGFAPPSWDDLLKSSAAAGISTAALLQAEAHS